MTEREWLASEDLAAMLRELDEATWAKCVTVSDRRLRLWCAACYLASEYSDPEPRRTWHWDKWADDPAENPKMTVTEALRLWTPKGKRQDLPPELAAWLLREILGNTFRPVNCPLLSKPHLLGRQVISLAQAAYEERLWRGAALPGVRPWQNGSLDPHRLAILADALEEEGCTNKEILQHLRGRELCWGCGGTGGFQANSTWVPCEICDVDDPEQWTPWLPLRGYHVRGCWALDLIRGTK